MDSDDTLTLDAVETVLRYHRRYEDEKNICGYAFLRVHLDGNVNGKEFVPNERVASYTEARVNSDDTMADKLLNGHLNKIIETAVRAGMPMEKAIYCATWTPSRRMHLDDRGMIAPGKIADFMLLDSLDGIDPVVVYKKGECVYCKDKEAYGAAEAAACSFQASFYLTINCRPAEISDYV